MASKGFQIKVGLDSTRAERGLARIGKSATRLNRSMGRIAGKSIKFGAALGAASVAMAAFAGLRFIKDSSRAAADFEKMALGFSSIMGSAEAASKRLKEIQDFSIKTPFEPTELMRASKTLQALGGDTAAIGAGLKMVAGAAAGTGEDLQVIAENVAKVYLGLMAGGEVAEATTQLMLMGVLAPDVADGIKKFVVEAKKGEHVFMTSAEALQEMKKGFMDTDKALRDFTNSTVGKVSTLKGHFEMLRIAFGTGINEGLVVGIDRMNSKIPEAMSAAKELGDAIGKGIGQALQGQTKLLELQVTFAFQKLAELGAGVFLHALGTGMTKIMPEIQHRMSDWFHNETIVGKLLKWTPVGAAGKLGHEGIWKFFESVGSDAFQHMDFQGLTAGAFGTPATAEEIRDILQKILDKEEPKRAPYPTIFGPSPLDDSNLEWLLKYSP